MQLAAIIITSLFFLLGIIGTVLPVMPGPAIIWVGMLIYGLMTGFEDLGITFFILQGIAAVMVFAVDYLASAVGTRWYGGSKYAVIGAITGLFLGILTLGFFGIIIGPFLGAFLGEKIKGMPADKAWRSSIGTLVGLMGGLFVKFFIEAAMIGWFIYAILR